MSCQLQECGATPLSFAAYEGHLDVVRLLVELEADINHPMAGGHGATPILLAAEQGHLEVVSFFLAEVQHTFRAQGSVFFSCLKNCGSWDFGVSNFNFETYRHPVLIFRFVKTECFRMD